MKDPQRLVSVPIADVHQPLVILASERMTTAQWVPASYDPYFQMNADRPCALPLLFLWGPAKAGVLYTIEHAKRVSF